MPSLYLLHLHNSSYLFVQLIKQVYASTHPSIYPSTADSDSDCTVGLFPHSSRRMSVLSTALYCKALKLILLLLLFFFLLQLNILINYDIEQPFSRSVY